VVFAANEVIISPTRRAARIGSTAISSSARAVHPVTFTHVVSECGLTDE
jgi:hypothetical protein